MKPVIIIAIAFVLLIPVNAFAETFEVRILEGSSTQGCEITDSCLSPSTITIHKGDTINWIRDEDTTHFIQSYTGSQMNWATMDYTHTFNDARTTQYTISEFPWVQGVVNVEYTQNQNKISNSIKFLSVEKIGKNLNLKYEGHMDTPSAVVAIYRTDTNQHVGDIQFGSDELGYFSNTWIDPDDMYHEWTDATYRVEFWSVDGDNGNIKSEIVETSFTLNVAEPQTIESDVEIQDTADKQDLEGYNSTTIESFDSTPDSEPLDIELEVTEKITCKNGYKLILKKSTKSPNCVKESSYEKLIKRGWGLNPESKTSLDSEPKYQNYNECMAVMMQGCNNQKTQQDVMMCQQLNGKMFSDSCKQYR